MNRLRILHLSGDYPDPVRQPTTQAIRHTIDHLPQFDHVVVSLDRTANPSKTYWTDCGQIGQAQVFACGQWGLPFGLALHTSFYLTARRIYQKMNAAERKPDMIHAHRLTFDGIGAYLLARWWNIPFVVSVRGEVESKVFRFKPLYHPLMRRIVRAAKAVYYVSMWYREPLQHYTKLPKNKERPFPNIVLNTTRSIKTEPAKFGLVSVFNYSIYKKKGLTRLLPAFRKALKIYPEMTLDLIGQTTREDHARVEELIKRHGLTSSVTAIGSLDHSKLLERLPYYHGLVLPSHNETFGMAYTEAIFSGIPVLYSANTGIDGYFDGLEIGARVYSDDEEDICRGLLYLWEKNADLRASIKENATELFTRFDPERHLAIYTRDVHSFINGARP